MSLTPHRVFSFETWILVGIFIAGAALALFFVGKEKTPLKEKSQSAAALSDLTSTSAEYLGGQFIVKFNAALREAADVIYAQKEPFQTFTADKSDSLDRLNDRFGVHAVRPLFEAFSRGADGSATTSVLVSRRAASARRLEAVKERYAARASRASPAGVLPALDHTYLFEVSETADIQEVVEAYRQDPHVSFVQPNYVVETKFAPNDPHYRGHGAWGQPYDDLWGLKKLELEQAWDITQGEGVIVAVVDTGVDWRHPDIAVNIWTNPGETLANGQDDDQNGYLDDSRGWDFANGDNEPLDAFGHGTHVAGIVAAVGDNSRGIVGVAPKARLMAVKVFSDEGRATIEWASEGIVYAAANGAEVINVSWGCISRCPFNPLVEEAVRFAHGLGAVVVVASGNEFGDVKYYSPANMPETIRVGAATETDTRAIFSNGGSLLDVVAPGGGTKTPQEQQYAFVNILSLKARECKIELCGLVVGTDYTRQAGTSMAAPHVSGVAALLLARHPELTNEAVRWVLRRSSDDVAEKGFDAATGAGRVNARRALGERIDAARAEITRPAPGALSEKKSSPLTIVGSAGGEHFTHYRLWYGEGLAPDAWIPLTRGVVARSVINGELGKWNIRSLAGGLYMLKLVVSEADGEEVEARVRVMLIDRKTP